MCSREILINSDQSFPASCYAFYDHDSGHIGMLPIQLFLILTKWIFGEDNGSPTYANIAGDIGGWMLPADYF